MTMGNGVVFAVAGSKGGVGKTTTSINLCAVLSEMGYEVVLVELDLAMANVGDFLDIDVGLEGEDPTLHEVLAGTATVVDATYDSPCEFDVVPSGASLRGFGDADVRAVRDVLATLRFAYEVVVLDTGAGVAPETLVPPALADSTVLVSSPRVASVRDTMKTRDLTRQVGGSVAGVVFVKSGTGRSPGVDHIADFLSVDLLGHIPEDSAVPDAQDVGLPVAVARRDSDAAAAYRALGERITELIDGFDQPETGVLSTDSTDRDGSGFSFVDDADEASGGAEDEDGGERSTDASDETLEPNATSAPSAHQAAGGRADGGKERVGSAAREAGDALDSATQSHASHGGDSGTGRTIDAGDADVAEALREAEDIDADHAAADVEHGDGTVVDADHAATRRDTDTDRSADAEDADGEDLASTVDSSETVAEGVAERRERADGHESAEETTARNATGTFAWGDAAESVEDDTEPTTPAELVTESVEDDTGPTTSAEAEPNDSTGTVDDAETDAHDDTEPARSAAKRFIDRAVGMVDRRND